MGKLIELFGKKFGLWTVRYKGPSTYQPMWLCVCECGSERLVSGANLRSGASTSCGCDRMHAERHGHARRSGKTLTYLRWKSMHHRCKPNSKDAKNYFERGIRVCDRWSSYDLFLEDVGECPAEMTLDRIDNDRGYEPGNTRWETKKTQRINNRRISAVEINGVSMPLKYASQRIGVTDTAVHQERARHGGSTQEAFDRVRARKPR